MREPKRSICRTPVAAVAYHGGGTERYLDEAQAITAPLLMHLAEDDESISRDAMTRIKAALAPVPSSMIASGCLT